jgi:ribonuclease PH
MRQDGRAVDELRPVRFQRGFIGNAEGSVLVEMGNTRVICTASVDNKVPRWMHGKGKGWVTAEYGMLPRATNTRSRREGRTGRPSGRTMEIQRLVGRALRSVVHMEGLGERTIWLDCDVIEADGGTRTASITGAFVALVEALEKLKAKGVFPELPLYDTVSAISCGVVEGVPVLDLPYPEDSTAEVDMNFVITGRGDLVEVQGTAEGAPFTRGTLDQLLDLATGGCATLDAQQRALFPDIDWDAVVTAWARD